eukprot:Ihof_evm3s481 gene=Ihof_evmTU3s481
MPLVRKNLVKGASEQILEEGSLYAAQVTMGGSQEMYLMIDTGSSDMLVVGSDCIAYDRNSKTLGCDKQFHPGQYEAGKCNLSNGFYNLGVGHAVNHKKTSVICYGDGTHLNYDIYSTNVTFAGVEAPNQYFGVITAQIKDNWSGNIDGILGIGYTTNSMIAQKEAHGTSIIDTMADAGHITDEFAMCFDHGHSWSIENGGRLILGGGDLPGMVYTKIIPGWYGYYDAYNILMDKVVVAGKQISEVTASG